MSLKSVARFTTLILLLIANAAGAQSFPHELCEDIRVAVYLRVRAQLAEHAHPSFQGSTLALLSEVRRAAI